MAGLKRQRYSHAMEWIEQCLDIIDRIEGVHREPPEVSWLGRLCFDRLREYGHRHQMCTYDEFALFLRQYNVSAAGVPA